MASKAPPAHEALPLPGTVSARPPALSIRPVPWRSFEEDGACIAWDALASNAAEPNPFFESWYLLPALRALDPGGTVQLLRFEAGGDLAGILPLARARRYYGWPVPHLTSWTHPNAFLGAPLVAHGLERPFWRVLLDWADRNAGLGLFLHLTDMPMGGPLRRALGDVLAEQGRVAALVHRAERAMLLSDAGPDAYLEASLSGKKRKELRRQSVRLSELGDISFHRENGREDLSRWIDDFLALEAGGWKGRAGSALACNPKTLALFREGLQRAAAAGKLERRSLRLDDKPIAMLANFVTPPGLFSFKTTFDELFSRYSPGVLLQCENLLVLDRQDIEWSDSCAEADHPMIDHLWRERRAIGRISIAIGGPIRRAIFSGLLRAELGRNPSGITA